MTLELSPIDITQVTLDAPDIDQLTTKAIAGTGVFDVLMSTVKLHLLEEFNQNRITGEEYANVYIGALAQVLQQSNAFLANHQNEEKIRAEIGLIRQKSVTELAQTDDDLPLGLGFNGSTVIEGLVANQKLLSAAQIDLTESQIITSTREGILVGQKAITELAQTDANLSTAALAIGLNDDAVIEGVVAAELLKISAETSLTEQKTTTELANTSNTKPLTLGEMGATTVIEGIAEAQREKTEAEVALLNQKKETEIAQTEDTVTAGAVGGILGKQMGLFQAQTDGFARDAEQKAAKLLLDTWSVSATVATATANTTNHLHDSDVGAVVTVLKDGIGAALGDA